MQPGAQYSIHFVNGNPAWSICLDTRIHPMQFESIVKILIFGFVRGVDDPALWAGKVGNSWRTTDDINDSWARYAFWTLLSLGCLNGFCMVFTLNPFIWKFLSLWQSGKRVRIPFLILNPTTLTRIDYSSISLDSNFSKIGM